MDAFRMVKAGEPITSTHPLVSAKRCNLLSQVARREQGIAEPGAGPPRSLGGGVAFGVVSSATAAEWNNATNTLTHGEVHAWMFSATGVIDREGPTVTLRHWWTEAPVEGSLVGGIRGDVVVMTCGALDGWS